MNCVAVIYKPAGLSSSDVVIKCRNALSKSLGQKIKCGHTGTLDPAAEGVLVLGFGKLTKLFDYVQKERKRYSAFFTFGKETDTFDREGSVVDENDFYPDILNVRKAVKTFIGETEQIPPAYSAVNVNGVRAYKLARKGEEVRIDAKKVTIYSINIFSEYCDEFGRTAEIGLDIECGSGTYIRSICRDLAEKVGAIAYMSSLKRTACGGFTEEDAVSLDAFLSDPAACVISEKDALSKLFSFIETDKETAKRLKYGQTVAFNSDLNEFVATCDGEILGICASEGGYIKLETHLWNTL